jgi:hypothetical protein
MEAAQPPLHFQSKDEASTTNGRALWQSVRRPHRGRQVVPAVATHGPYETSYPIASGYPEREIIVR